MHTTRSVVKRQNLVARPCADSSQRNSNRANTIAPSPVTQLSQGLDYVAKNAFRDRSRPSDKTHPARQAVDSQPRGPTLRLSLIHI